MIGHHFATICCSVASALQETGCDLGGRPACLHDMDTCCQLSISSGETLCDESVMPCPWCIDCRFGCSNDYQWIFVARKAFQVVSASLGDVQCREQEMETINCDAENTWLVAQSSEPPAGH